MLGLISHIIQLSNIMKFKIIIYSIIAVLFFVAYSDKHEAIEKAQQNEKTLEDKIKTKPPKENHAKEQQKEEISLLSKEIRNTIIKSLEKKTENVVMANSNEALYFLAEQSIRNNVFYMKYAFLKNESANKTSYWAFRVTVRVKDGKLVVLAQNGNTLMSKKVGNIDINTLFSMLKEEIKNDSFNYVTSNLNR